MGRGVRRATNRTIFVAGRCARHDGWPKCFSRRGRRGGMARRVADRTLRSDVTGGRPRAVVLAIVRRGSCDCALRLMLEEGTKRTNGNAPPARTGGGACFGTGRARQDGHMPRFMRLRAACHEPQFIRSCAVVHAPARRLTCGRAAAPAIVRRLPLRLCAAAIFRGRNETDKRETRPSPVRAGARVLGRGRCCRIVFAAGLGRCVRSGAAQFLRGWPDCARKCDGRGDGGAACGVRLTGLFSWRGWGGAPGMEAGPSVFCGAAGGAAWRVVWLTGLCAAM